MEVRRGLSPADVERRITPFLPEGVEITGAEEVPRTAPSTAQATQAFRYRISPRDVETPLVLEALTASARKFADASEWPLVRKTKHGPKEDDLKRWVQDIAVLPTCEVELTLKAVDGGTVKPEEAYRSLFGVTKDAAPFLRILKFL